MSDSIDRTNNAMYQAAFDAFMVEVAEESIISSTKASWGGSNYAVELFDDGNYRVLWSGNIGNRYVSTGMVLGIPTLSDDEYDEEHGHFFDNALELLRMTFESD